RLCLSTLGSRYEIWESSTARPIGGQGVDYGFFSIVDAEARRQVMRDMRREMGDTQTELLALREQRRARQPAPDARIPDHQD
ncbi:hypothetical protein Tco_0631999, partial [Tanacetum coccineum]